MMNCPKCGTELPLETNFCNFCGYDFSQINNKKKFKHKKWVFVLIAAFLAAGIFVCGIVFGDDIKSFSVSSKNTDVYVKPKLGITYTLARLSDVYAEVVVKEKLPTESIIILSVSNDSDLYDSRVMVGDMITAVNGYELDSVNVFEEIVDNSQVGDKLTITICRVKKDYSIEKFDIKVVLVEDKGSTDTAIETKQTENKTMDNDKETTYISPYDYFAQYG